MERVNFGYKAITKFLLHQTVSAKQFYHNNIKFII
jgi:hypothetical protein